MNGNGHAGYWVFKWKSSDIPEAFGLASGSQSQWNDFLFNPGFKLSTGFAHVVVLLKANIHGQAVLAQVQLIKEFSEKDIGFREAPCLSHRGALAFVKSIERQHISALYAGYPMCASVSSGL